MTKQSEKVKRWRKRTKERIIKAMGGQCACCGYKKCDAALVLHHINPEKKEFGLGAIRASSIAWPKIVIELRKCVMVCHNCHNEIHNNILKIPEDAPKFNEKYAIYKLMHNKPQKYYDEQKQIQQQTQRQIQKQKREEKQKLNTHPCKKCGKPAKRDRTYCSISCAAFDRSTKIIWPNTNVLIEMVEQSSYLAVGKKLGVSDNAIRKRIKNHPM